ncbi:hypothetical protein BJD20_18030 [Acinetobacter proteolyticus]|jgi:hypothetical protein|uniref:hypothetical protein n=1 Tax=Acinetobacter proteolyticus TaxID=1776741 RepID=UPI00086334AA|nr:hypothetical protein [Acinetobacter proteolyticus]OEY94653.1 hypothetical protein BJD20_18030 [Acinetobacter proteolyticus]WEI18003.1 hypothetical protein PY247_17020 [Acinetobacter proteolyticus]
MWILILTLIIGLLILLFARKFQNTNHLSSFVSENESFVDNVLYTFEIVAVRSFQQNLKQIVASQAKENLIEVTANLISEPSNKFDKNAIKVQINGLNVGYLSRNDAQQFAEISMDKKVAAVINEEDGVYSVKLAIQNLEDLKD